jgi:hypothetical protein
MNLFEKEKIPQTKKAKKAKVAKVMHHWKEGEQNIGKSDKKVPMTTEGQKQAVAIALSMSGQSNKKKKNEAWGQKPISYAVGG